MQQLDLFEEWPDTIEESSNTQVCPSCKIEKDISEYHIYENLHQTGSRRKCKKCYSANNSLLFQLKKENKYPHENPKCDCCGCIPEEKLQLDHCHETKVFRGWLCRSCNGGLGGLGDTVEGVQKGLTYLRKHYEKD